MSGRGQARLLAGCLLGFALGSCHAARAAGEGPFFPPPGESLALQELREPYEVGLDPAVVAAIDALAEDWALWRDGFLVHVEGDFNLNHKVKSLRKTWHALSVGAALQQDVIPSLNQKISVFQTSLIGNDAAATWMHVLTQSSSFVYPGCGDASDYLPGEMWTYSDTNVLNLNDALAKAYGHTGYEDNYREVLEQALFDAIGMQGWGLRVRADGIRLRLDFEDLGRLGLLALARGEWAGGTLVPPWFVRTLETKQTAGMTLRYIACGESYPTTGIRLTPELFPESPYGLMTWVNSDADLLPGADPAWVYGAGSGGTYAAWNRNHGIFFAGTGVDAATSSSSIPHVIEAAVVGPNPQLAGFPAVQLTGGDILVGARGEPGEAASRILRATPGSLELTTVSSSALLSNPVGVESVGDALVYVLDDARLLQVDPTSGEVAVVSEGGLLTDAVLPEDDPKGLALDGGGWPLVADPSSASVVRIDPQSGAQTLLAAGDLLVTPRDLAVAANGEIFVADRCATGAADCLDGGAIIRIDPSTGAQSLVASVVHPESIAIAPSGNLLVHAEATLPGNYGIIEIDPATGAAIPISEEHAGTEMPFGLALEQGGSLLYTRDGVLFRVDDAGGSVSALLDLTAPNGPNSFALGIALVRAACEDGVDNDGDGFTDFPSDLGCQTFGALAEAVCGDGVIDASESCDDGNSLSGDGCAADCTIESCGDSSLEAAEECDDGNQEGGDGCSADCTLEACGNARLDVGEECDDGALQPGDGCSSLCLLEECGNGRLDPGEQCDDGGNVWRDGCRADCSVETCGDGIVDPGEECDDGNSEAEDGCTSSCTAEPCIDGWDNDGDGLTDYTEDPGCQDALGPSEDPECQDGVDNDGDGGIDWDGAGAGPPDRQCRGRPYWGLEKVGGSGRSRRCGVGGPGLLGLALLRARKRRAPQA